MAKSPDPDRYHPISDYALIGDCHTAALVARDGSIDFCCLPHFNSGAVFCRLLDKHKGGYFQLSAGDNDAFNRQYLRNTNVLASTFRTERGEVIVTDLMAVRKTPPDDRGRDIAAPNRIIRRVVCTNGTSDIRLTLKATPDFARQTVKVTLASGKGAIIESQSGCFALTWPADLAFDGVTLHGGARVVNGQQIDCTLTYCQSLAKAEDGLSNATDIDHQVGQSVDYWKEWAASCSYSGPYQDAVMRSALALKLMTFEPTGAIIASPTTSLPEEIGGERNWDYRQTWLRDSTFTLLALLRLGYVGEARDFMGFIRRICAHHSQRRRPFQILYGIDGETRLTEVTLDHLEGYCGSRPVRVGNAAYRQRQLDVYGEVLDCIYVFYLRGGFDHDRKSEMTSELLTIVTEIVEWTARHWRQADSGIWEVRSDRKHYVYSKVMCWVALDRGIKLAEAFRLSVDLANCRKVKQEIRESILTCGFNERVGAFTQSYGSDALDASALEIPLVGFLPADDRRVIQTVDLIETRLTKNGMVFRYLSDDGLSGSEATFSMCTFWLISCLARMGKHNEARERFEYMLSRANDVGLYAEEMDAASGIQLGNFPQAFTHISLINAATELGRG